MPPVASNNEPIGPLSSVEEDADPLRIVSAAAVTFVASLPLYVLHSQAGVRGDLDFDALPNAQQTFDGLRALQRLAPRDLPAGRPLDHSSPDAPLVLLSPLWPWSGDEAGLVGAFTSVARDGFSLIAIGIRDHASFRAARAMNVEVFDLLSGERLQQEPAAVGDPVLLGGRPAVFVRGTWR
jgi:hypothetical protein